MVNLIQEEELHEFDIDATVAAHINTLLQTLTPEEAWKKISHEILTPQTPFKLHLRLFALCYPTWREYPNLAAAWIPDEDSILTTHLFQMMTEMKIASRADFHAFSVKHSADFWQLMLKKLDIRFSIPPQKIVDLSNGVEKPNWLPGAQFNMSDSCFKANPKKIAVIQQKKSGPIEHFTYAELNQLSNRIANSLLRQGAKPGDAIAIDMPMHMNAVAIYFGIIKMGGVVVSIADSFSPEEIAVRLRIAKTKMIFTQDIILRDNKKIPLYEKVIAANAPIAIVLPCENELHTSLRKEDISWQNFLVADDHFEAHLCDAKTPCNILFSSGTTGDPKAIPWTHATPIKAASDAYLHQDIHTNDILAWPTNLGWMMGPWLIFAAMINDATIALFDDAPRNREFGLFIQNAKVTMLGVVPTQVANWRQTQCMQGLNWQHIKRFSSTGECSNPEDMLYLMSLAGYKPIIEYCGGTEIGGAYISSTMLENNYPSIFTTPAMGLDFVLIDENGELTENGEVALIPPSIGLSNELLNADHHKTYFTDMPKLADGRIIRRHGDQIQRFSDQRYFVLGRVDDTMNLGAIKVSSAEIERVLVGTENIIETAAIGVTLDQYGPSHLVIYAATKTDLDKEKIKKLLQLKINEFLNPLFKIHDVIFIRELPKTASNKIMRRVLRKQYQDKSRSP